MGNGAPCDRKEAVLVQLATAAERRAMSSCAKDGVRAPLRGAAEASRMMVFSFGLVPAQAFRAPEIPSRRDGSENGKNRRIKT
jgi:hypothetical protein